MGKGVYTDSLSHRHGYLPSFITSFSTFTRLHTNHSRASSSGYEAKCMASQQFIPHIIGSHPTSAPILVDIIQQFKLLKRCCTNTTNSTEEFSRTRRETIMLFRCPIKKDAQNLKLQHTHHSRCTGLYFCHKGGNFYHWRTEHTLSVGELQNAIGVLTHESFSLVLRFRLEIAILEHALLYAVTLHSAYCITVSRRWVPYTQSHSGYSQAEQALHNLSLALYKRKANIPISRLLSPLFGINKQALKYFKRRKVKEEL